MSAVPFLPDFPRPLIFAHRGWSSVAPENTMAAFRLARERGAPGVELDVHLTADGRLAIIHDHDTGRVDGSGPGAGLPLEGTPWLDLVGREVGSWKDPRYRGERIPLLGELFEELGRALYFDVELKNDSVKDHGLEAAVAKAIRDADGGRGLGRRVVVSSFNPISMARFKRLMPEIATAIIWMDDEEIPSRLRRGQGRFIGRTDARKPCHTDVTPAMARRWKGGVWPFLPWTVDEPEAARRMLSLGAIGLISNDPGALGVLKPA